MKRDLAQLSNKVYDLCVIGGGIYGACVAWEATLRGLSVALVEKADFCSATSANSLKIIHGGLRYLQHADFRRMRESICERRALMRIAPHLVHPLPVLIPTYGHGMQGKELLSLALLINDLVSFDRNRLDDPEKHIPRGRVISRKEVMQLVPDIDGRDLTGGAIFHDAQVYNSERLVLSFLRSAAKAGADLANYVEVTGFLKEGDRIIGVNAKDILTGDRLNIRARLVVNTSGPWGERVAGLLDGSSPKRGAPLAKAINLVTRPLFQKYAVGLTGKKAYRDAGALINRGNRFLFIAPWRGYSLIGTDYMIYDGDPDYLKVTKSEIQGFLDEVNQAYPSAGLKMEDVLFVHAGLLPRHGVCQRSDNIRLTQHHQLRDHRKEGIEGLISVVGVKYTTARHVAEKAVDMVFRKLGMRPQKSATAVTPLHGGQIEQFDAFLTQETERRPEGLSEEDIRHLIYNYGSEYHNLLKCPDTNSGSAQRITGTSSILRAEVLYGIREEMVQKLADVIFRRTELGSAGYPGDKCIKACAFAMAQEFGWDEARVQGEIDEVSEVFPATAPVARFAGNQLYQ